MTSFGPFKVFHLKYSTTGHNFIGHYFALHFRFTDIDKSIINDINSKNKLKTVHLHQINNELY